MPQVNGLEAITLGNDSNSVSVTLFGGHVYSWICGGIEQLYMSKSAVWDGKKALRGGIPVVFPQFGRPLDTMAQHGFARNYLWTIASTTEDEVVLELKDNDSSRSQFPHKFCLQYAVKLSPNKLSLSLKVHNLNADESFQCHTLLHSYFAINSQNAIVTGFGPCKFVDKTSDMKEFPNEGETNAINKEIDRIYYGHESNVTITDDKKSLVVNHSANLDDEPFPTDVVLWNAWIDKCKSMGDLDDDAYLKYVCVEPGTVKDWVTLEPGSILNLKEEITYF
jgi:glucose-6-phosphate 1-epimerase